MTTQNPDRVADAAPSTCPACGSKNLTTTSKTIDAATYWRCVACGEVWNVGRRDGQHERLRSRRGYW